MQVQTGPLFSRNGCNVISHIFANYSFESYDAKNGEQQAVTNSNMQYQL